MLGLLAGCLIVYWPAGSVGLADGQRTSWLLYFWMVLVVGLFGLVVQVRHQLQPRLAKLQDLFVQGTHVLELFGMSQPVCLL